MTAGGDDLSQQLDGARLAPDAESDRLRQRIQAELFSNAHSRPRLDRFVLLRELGRGAMGMVYAAYDPKLDRKVALKLVRVDAQREGAQETLIAEARAAASLSHPNVVAIYDVGAADDDVFIAMEHVAGGTLQDWADDERTPSEIVELYVQAGRGLAAAHAAGLVHRDFKPANVLVGHDTTGQLRARVADFGLARNHATDDSTVRGTPAYMSPEQHAGESLDARSDQFSFCVALWEALYGRRPFANTARIDTAALADDSRVVPTYVRQVCERGLAKDPADRFADMSALLDALTTDPARKTRSWVARGVLVAFGASLAVAAVIAQGKSEPDACPIDRSQLAGIWDSESRLELQAAFESTGAPFWSETWSQFAASLDRYTDSVFDMQRASCRATNVFHQQSTKLLDLRSECLRGRMEAVDALVNALVKPTRKDLGKVVSAAQKLPPVTHCADAAALQRRPPPPADKRDLVVEQNRRMLRARSLRDLGRYKEGVALAKETAGKARDLGYMPLTGEALLVYGTLQVARGEYKNANATLHEALAAGVSGRSDWVVARASTTLVWSIGYWQSDPENARVWEQVAEAALSAMGGNPTLESALRDHQGAIAHRSGNYKLAEAKSRDALAIVERAFGADDLRVARSLVNLTATLNRQKKFRESEGMLNRALPIFRSHYGNHHPHVAVALGNLAATIRDPKRGDEKLALLRESLRIKEAVLGKDHLSLVSPLSRISHLLADMKRFKESLTFTKRGIALTLGKLGPKSPEAQGFQLDAAITYLELENFAEALHVADLGVAATTTQKGDTHARFLTMRTRALVGLGRSVEAVEAGKKSLARYGPRHRYDEDLGETKFAIARALWSTGKRRDAKKLAQAARRHYEKASEAVEATKVAKWLASHPR